mmetsp:Transcript_58023/g.152535  ORF Transcript_58023/g.152535 Transcript_58023/m.152535 type:complete len:91 (+) Transcript_58023:152-424(+)
MPRRCCDTGTWAIEEAVFLGGGQADCWDAERGSRPLSESELTLEFKPPWETRTGLLCLVATDSRPAATPSPFAGDEFAESALGEEATGFT